MADPTYKLQDNPVYNEEIRALQNNDPANAETIFNPVLEAMINNTHYAKLKGDELEKQLEEVAEEAGGSKDAGSVLLSDGASVEDAIGDIQKDLSTHEDDTTKHLTDADRSKWDAAATTATEAKSAAAAAQETANAAKEAIDNVDISSHFILSIDFASSFSGKVYTVTGGGLNHTGNVPDGLHVVVEAPVGDTMYTVSCDGYTVEIPVGQHYGVYSGTLKKSLSAMSWPEIVVIAESGEAENYWSVGDEKIITLTTGEELTLQIYGFNHDDLASGGKAGITFGLKNLMAETRRMETNNTNKNSFSGSEMYSWIKETLLPSLPGDLQSIIKPVVKKTSAGSESTTMLSEAMSIFLFSEVEVFGVTTSSAAGEGSKYPIFSNDASRRKYMANGIGSANSWWTRSPRGTNATSFSSVASNGGTGSSVGSSTIGVCFGFCIGKGTASDLEVIIESHNTDEESHQDIREALANKANEEIPCKYPIELYEKAKKYFDCYFTKNIFGEVILCCSLQVVSRDNPILSQDVIAYLPEGFRPQETIEVPCALHMYNGGLSYSLETGTIVVSGDGEVRIVAKFSDPLYIDKAHTGTITFSTGDYMD